MSKAFHVDEREENAGKVWEVRDRADVWVADFASKREAQAWAKQRNAECD